MNLEEKFIFNSDGDNKWIMKIKNNSEIFGNITKDWNKDKTKQIFSIKYYWKKVLQDEKFADTLEEAENKLKDILVKVSNKVKYIETTFEGYKKL